jgi:large subunit ribosomal protein L3
MRTGVITRKLGMSALFDKQGRRVPVTVLRVDDCQVIGHRTFEKDGVSAVRVGYGKIKPNKISKAHKGHYLKHKLDFKRHVADFRVASDALVEVGAKIGANHYVIGQFIDATGTSIGKGFAGAMKRHGFSGLRASHGVSITHRSHGSTGQRQDPGKVFKNKKMAGHMGATRVTTQNLEVLLVDTEKNLLFVKGAVPGSENSYVLVQDAKKKSVPPEAPYPYMSKPRAEAVSENEIAAVVETSKEQQV